MAVAVQPSPETKKPAQPMGLYAASAIGAVYVLAALALVLRLIPWLWDSGGVHQAITTATNNFVAATAEFVTQVVAAGVSLYVGSRLARGSATPGVRGGTFLMLATALIGVFVLKGLFERAGREFSFAGIVVMLVYAVVIFLLVQFYRTGKFATWAVAIHDGGWLHAQTHKRTQGLRVRRLTMLGLILVAGTGIWTLTRHNYLPTNSEVVLPTGERVSNRMGDWVVGGRVLEPQAVPRDATPAEREQIQIENRARPRHVGGVTLLPDLQYTIPILLMILSMWFIWRAVNYPQFADFLIATEAEINKVSWTSRRALLRDTIVVLTTLFLLTVFLFVVDLFWNSLLSSRYVGVLPTAEERARAVQGDRSPEPVKDW